MRVKNSSSISNGRSWTITEKQRAISLGVVAIWIVRMRRLPVFSGTQMRDVCDMMARVPCISERQKLHRHRAILWMMAPAFPLLVVERLQQHHPAGMQTLYKLQRPLDRSRDVVQLRPGNFIIGLDRRPVFSQ